MSFYIHLIYTKMPYSLSPLRYPGGKSRAINILKEHVHQYYPDRRICISPFLGGGSFELSMMSECDHVYANDKFFPLYTFWNEWKTNSVNLVDAVQQLHPVTKEQFHYYRNSIDTVPTTLLKAAYYYVINRCSFSGATFCGGFSQESAERRFNQSSIDRLKDVNLTKISFSCLDAVEFLHQHPETSETYVYADPPYYITNYVYGRDGDLHEQFDHKAFAEYIQTRSDYLISYNDCEYIRDLYKNSTILSVQWSYGMNKTKKSNEILIVPKV